MQKWGAAVWTRQGCKEWCSSVDETRCKDGVQQFARDKDAGTGVTVDETRCKDGCNSVDETRCKDSWVNNYELDEW